MATSWRYTCRYRRVPTKHKRELSGSASPAAAAWANGPHCWQVAYFVPAVRTGAPREVRPAYLRDPNVDIAKLGKQAMSCWACSYCSNTLSAFGRATSPAE